MITPAVAAHAEALALIHAASFPPGAQWGPAVMAAQLALPGVFGLIDPAGGMVLGRVAADEAEILTLAVAPETRRRGVGRALLRAAMAAAGQRGARTMLLEAGAANAAALAMYASCGFVPVGQRRRYYTDGTDAVVLRAAIISCG